MSQQQPPKHKKIFKPTKNAPAAVPVPEDHKPKPKKATSVHQLPTIQNMMEIPSEERAERANAYFEQVKPFLAQYMQKKQGSRVLQLIFKWGGEGVRKAIHKCGLTNWKDLIRSKYALFILQKLSKDYDFPGAVEDAVLLQSSWEGARILQHSVERSEENMKAVKDKFYQLWEKSKEGDLKGQENLHNLALKIIEKQYDGLVISKLVIRLAIGSMFAEEKQKVLDYLVTKVAQLVNDDEGVRLFIELVNLCDPKLKKTIIRAFKGHLAEIVELNNPSYVAVIKLLTEVDDTVQLQKSLIPEVEALLPSIVSNKHAFSIIFSLFSPRNHNFNILGKYEHAVRVTECKKPEEQRKSQLRSRLYDSLLAFLDGEPLYQILRHHVNNKLIVGVYKSLQEDNQTEHFSAFVSKVATLYLADAKETLKNGTFAESLCADSNANKIIKGILWLQDEVVDYYCDEFAKLAVKNIDQFLCSRASFVLLGLVEKGGRDYLLNEVRKNKSKLGTSPVGKFLQPLLSGKKQ